MAITKNELLATYHKVATLSDEEVRQVLFTGYTKKIATSKNLKRALLATILSAPLLSYGGGKLINNDFNMANVLADIENDPEEILSSAKNTASDKLSDLAAFGMDVLNKGGKKYLANPDYKKGW